MEAADFVKSTIKKFGTNEPFEIAEKANVSIVYESWHPTTIGEFERQTKRILINSRAFENDENAEKLKRAVVAHELGHYFAAEFDLNKREEERFARDFAAELLK